MRMKLCTSANFSGSIWAPQQGQSVCVVGAHTHKCGCMYVCSRTHRKTHSHTHTHKDTHAERHTNTDTDGHSPSLSPEEPRVSTWMGRGKKTPWKHECTEKSTHTHSHEQGHRHTQTHACAWTRTNMYTPPKDTEFPNNTKNMHLEVTDIFEKTNEDNQAEMASAHFSGFWRNGKIVGKCEFSKSRKGAQRLSTVLSEHNFGVFGEPGALRFLGLPEFLAKISLSRCWVGSLEATFPVTVSRQGWMSGLEFRVHCISTLQKSSH